MTRAQSINELLQSPFHALHRNRKMPILGFTVKQNNESSNRLNRGGAVPVQSLAFFESDKRAARWSFLALLCVPARHPTSQGSCGEWRLWHSAARRHLIYNRPTRAHSLASSSVVVCCAAAAAADGAVHEGGRPPQCLKPF